MEYIIKWNSGFGDEYDVVDADSEQAARDMAYEQWKEEAENNAVYGVVGEATKELKDTYGVE